MAVTPTPEAYGRDNPRLPGRCLEKLSGLRVWVETPRPPVFGKERSPENVYFSVSARFPALDRAVLF